MNPTAAVHNDDGKTAYKDLRGITGKRGKSLPHAVDKAGQIAFHLPAGLEFPWHFSAGIAPIIKDGKWGFIDRSGSIVVSPQYSAVLRYDVLWMMGSSM